MKTFSCITGFLAGGMLALTAGTANANFYGGLEYGLFDYQEASGPDAEPEGVRFRLGYRWNQHLGTEVHYGFGASEDEVSFGGNDVAVDVNTYQGIYLRGILPIGERFNLYAIGGYSTVEVERIINDSVSDSLDDDDYSYGIGADMHLFKTFYLSVDYMRLIDTSSFEADTLNVGVRFNFRPQ